MAQIQLDRLPQTDDELWHLVRALWGVTIPRHKTCDEHVAPFDVFADAYFRRGPSISLWLGSRGLSGKSFLLSILGLTIAFLKGSDVNLLGGSLAQSTNIHEHMRSALDYKNAPRYMIEAEGNYLIKLTNGARIRPLTASQKTVRGPHPATLLCLAEGSEVDTPVGPVEIQDMPLGHVVYGSDDMGTQTTCIVTRKSRSGYQTTVVLETSNGSITCTPNHKIWTQRGWVEAGQLTTKDVLSVRKEADRSLSKHDRSMRSVLRRTEDNSPQGLQGMWRDNSWQRKPKIRYVPGLLGNLQEQSSSNTNVSLLQRNYVSDRNRVQRLSQQTQSSKSSALLGLQQATENKQHQALSSVSSKVDEQRQSSVQVRSSESNWEERSEDFQSGRTGFRTTEQAGDRTQQISTLREVDSRYCSEEPCSSDRGSRSILARQAERSGEGPEKASGARSRRIRSDLLENGSDASLVEGHIIGIHSGPVVQTWDITTTTGNFFTQGVLVHNCDEIDEMDQDILDAALGQPMPQTNYLGEIIKPYTVLCSTHQNADGTVTEMKKRWAEKGQEVKLWCFEESASDIDGWLTQEDISRKKSEIPIAMWNTEYLLNEPSIGNRAFDTAAVEEAFSLPLEPLEQQHKENLEEYTFEQPQKSGIYVVAADWAKEKDKTVICVVRLDTMPHSLVYYMRVNRRPYPMMIKWFNDAIEKYHAEAIHDATGLGNVVNDYIDTRARKFIMTGEKRSNMLTEFVGAIERGYFRFPDITSAHLEMKYCRTGDLYSGATKDYHLPDTVCTFALAWNIGKQYSGYGEPITVSGLKNQPGRIESMFSMPREAPDDVTVSSFEVVDKTEEVAGEISLTV